MAATPGSHSPARGGEGLSTGGHVLLFTNHPTLTTDSWVLPLRNGRAEGLADQHYRSGGYLSKNSTSVAATVGSTGFRTRWTVVRGGRGRLRAVGGVFFQAAQCDVVAYDFVDQK